jgi:DNA-binding LacI/PurR family transcriptional regulator
MSRVDLAKAAVKALKAHIVEGGNPQREYKIDTHLVLRESTAYPPGTMNDLKAT